MYQCVPLYMDKIKYIFYNKMLNEKYKKKERRVYILYKLNSTEEIRKIILIIFFFLRKCVHKKDLDTPVTGK